MWRWLPFLLLQFLSQDPSGSEGAISGACSAWAASTFSTQRVFWIAPSVAGARNDGLGTQVQPWSSLHAARRNDLRTGDVIVVAPGLYRDAIHPKAHGLTIAGCPGEEVVITGADPLNTRWRKAGVGWAALQYRPLSGFGDRYDPNLVVADGRLLIPAKNMESLTPGSFAVDAQGQELVVRLLGDRDPNSARIEVGVRDVLFDPPGSSRCEDKPANSRGVNLLNLTFVHAANPAQTGAVCLAGTGGSVVETVIRETNGRGLEVWGSNHSIRQVRANRNGHLGLGGGCQGCLVEDVTANGNNWRMHDPFWEAGGAKWVSTKETIIRRFVARDNEGPGLWFDGFSSNNRVEASTLIGNLVSGIQVELGSNGNQIIRSAVVATRRDGWAGEGVLIMASDGTRLEENVIAHNAGSGVWLRKDSRQPTGGTTLIGNLFLDNATESTGWNFQVRLEIDARPGEETPRFEMSANHLVARDLSELAGVRLSRGEDVRRMPDIEAFHDALGVNGPTYTQTTGSRRPCIEVAKLEGPCRLVSAIVR